MSGSGGVSSTGGWVPPPTPTPVGGGSSSTGTVGGPETQPAGTTAITVVTQICGAGSKVTLQSELNAQLSNPNSILLGPYCPYTQYAVPNSQAIVRFAVEKQSTQMTSSAAYAASYFAMIATLVGLLANVFVRC